MALHREIHPEYETVGKRRKMIGVRAQVFDDTTLVYDRTHGSYSEAENACIAYEYDLISDGLVYSATELDGGAVEMPGPVIVQPEPEATPRYTRCPAFDNARHGCAWRDTLGLVMWRPAGVDPNAA